MADLVFNIAKGRVVEYYNRVKGNDPTNAALVLVPLSAVAADATLKDQDDLATVLAGGSTECTDGTWARKVLTDSELAALPAPDDGNDRYDVSLPEVTWSALTGTAMVAMLVCYDSDTTGGTDANIVPLTKFDAAATPDGNDLVMSTGVFFRAA